MAATTNIFTHKETNNWFKAYIALNLTKEGLTNFVVSELKNVHSAIGISCGQCSIANLMPCPTQGLCKKRKQYKCTFHTSQLPKSCQTCDKVKQNIKSLHRFNLPSWRNSKAESWVTNPWEIGKCYLPPDGYSDVSSVQESDFNGVISILLNCKHFQTCLSPACLSPPPPDKQCPLEKIRQIGRDVRHTADCKVTDAELQDYFKTLATLLGDPICLLHDTAAIDAHRKLSDNDQLTLAGLGELLKEANQTLTHAKEVRERLSEEAAKILQNTLEATIQVGVLRIQSETMDSIVRIKQAANEKGQDDYERGVADLLRPLEDHYRDTVSFVPLSTLDLSRDKKVQDIYASPKIQRIKIENDGRRTKLEQVFTYKDFFYRDNQLSRRTYLQGEPGSGKTTFVAKLVNDWCNVHVPSMGSTKGQTALVDVDTLQKFKFIFFISLRDSRNQTCVTQMIKTQLIDKMYADDKSEAAYNLVLKIMTNATCLVIQDGLDEWSGEDALPSMAGIPQDHCIVLTTSRPWKLADERIRNSQIDNLLDLEGIIDPKAFRKKELRCLLHESNDLEKTVKQFEEFLISHNLRSISVSPMLHTLIICTWVEGIAERLSGSSLCELYTILLESLCKKANPFISHFSQSEPLPEFAKSVQEKEKKRYERYLEKKRLQKLKKEREQIERTQQQRTEGARLHVRQTSGSTDDLEEHMGDLDLHEGQNQSYRVTPSGKIEDDGDFSDFYKLPDHVDPAHRQVLQELQDEELAKLLQEQEHKRTKAEVDRAKLREIEAQDALLAEIMQEQEKIRLKKAKQKWKEEQEAKCAQEAAQRPPPLPRRPADHDHRRYRCNSFILSMENNGGDGDQQDDLSSPGSSEDFIPADDPRLQPSLGHRLADQASTERHRSGQASERHRSGQASERHRSDQLASERHRSDHASERHRSGQDSERLRSVHASNGQRSDPRRQAGCVRRKVIRCLTHPHHLNSLQDDEAFSHNGLSRSHHHNVTADTGSHYAVSDPFNFNIATVIDPTYTRRTSEGVMERKQPVNHSQHRPPVALEESFEIEWEPCYQGSLRQSAIYSFYDNTCRRCGYYDRTIGTGSSHDSYNDDEPGVVSQFVPVQGQRRTGGERSRKPKQPDRGQNSSKDKNNCKQQ